ncbi:fumarylacetoacetate hydrolase [Pisolithus albus]|nr:fumarylacetoacetate hydrolase [Pisolithus albus]
MDALIRFVAAETPQVHIGEPVDPTLDEILGSAVDPAAQLTNTILTVKELLSSRSREEVKTVCCLGSTTPTTLWEYPVPILFCKLLASLIGPNAPIFIPGVAQPVEDHPPDYEVELTIVIGKAAKNVSEADALDYVTGANDVSDSLLACCGVGLTGLFPETSNDGLQWGFSKSFDNTTPLGPCVVSNNAIPNPQLIPLTCNLNGKILQNRNTQDQIFDVRKAVAFLSQATTLEPGAVLFPGTSAGVGYVRKPPGM